MQVIEVFLIEETQSENYGAANIDEHTNKIQYQHSKSFKDIVLVEDKNHMTEAFKH